MTRYVWQCENFTGAVMDPPGETNPHTEIVIEGAADAQTIDTVARVAREVGCPCGGEVRFVESTVDVQ